MQHGPVAGRVWYRYLQEALPTLKPRRAFTSTFPRQAGLSAKDSQVSSEKTRNIGIIAHIDAVRFNLTVEFPYGGLHSY